MPITYDSLDPKEKEAINNLLAEIKSFKVIPIIGYELFNELITDGDDKNFLKWLTKLLVGKPDNFLRTDFIDNTSLCGIDYINDCYQNFNVEAKYSSFGEEIREICKNCLSDIPTPSIINKLIKIKFFNFYIDTTILGMVERSLTTYRLSKDGKKNNYVVLNPTNLTIDETTINLREKLLLSSRPLKIVNKPVIWNFFGSFYEDDIINITDIHLQEILYAYISSLDSDKLQGYKIMSPLFEKVNFLFIGCSFKDWIFRFILRFLSTDKLEDPLKRKLVIDEVFLNNTDISRNLFITNKGIRSFKMSSEDFVNILFEQIVQQSQNIESKHTCRIFISFINENRNIAETVYNELTLIYGLDCFLDQEEINSGTDINEEIEKAIDDCSVFIPIVTNQLDMGAQRNSVAFAEWNYAIQKQANNALEIMPIYSDNYDSSLLIKMNNKKYDSIRRIIDKGFRGTILHKTSPFVEKSFLKDLKIYQFKCRTKNG